MNIDEAKALERACLLNLYTPIRMPMVIARGEGARLWDTEGREYLDFVSGGRAVTGLGHCHPKVVEAIRQQAGELIHVSNDFFSEPQLLLAQRLSGLFGGRCFFCNSGAEAVEAAIKLARKHAYKAVGPDKHHVITVLRSFHGRTMGALAATGQPKYQQAFQPLPAGFVHVPFNDVAALEAAVDARTCAVMLEPILGESGVYPATAERSLKDLADKVPSDKRQAAERAIAEVRQALESKDLGRIRSAADELQRVFAEISQAAYQAASEQAAAGAPTEGAAPGREPGEGGDEGVIDAEFRESE